ncbi:MAG: hypothetical protein WCK34_16700 [Bacteroidota bacterium]
MILLTVYKAPEGKREKREFVMLQDAIEFGQKTGSDYEIYDPGTGKVIDWNEINVRDEDDWYYDENEYLWKKLGPDDGFYNGSGVPENRYGFMAQTMGNSSAAAGNLLHSRQVAGN